MADPVPLDDLIVNKRFWLGQGRKVVESRVTRVEDAAGKLLTAVAWFWTVYTAAAFVGVALTDRNLEPWAIVVIFLPAVALIAAYSLGTWVLMPVYTSFIAGSAAEIEDALTATYEEKKRRLFRTVMATAAAAVLLVIAVGVTAAADPVSEQSLIADVEDVGGASSMLVGGQFVANQQVTVTVDPGAKPVDAAAPAAKTVSADSSGRLDATFTLTGSAQDWTVTATWIEDDIKNTQVLTVPG